MSSDPPDGQKVKQPYATEYLPLQSAAKRLRTDAASLLHLGALGKIEVITPVATPGEYVWPLYGDGFGYPEFSSHQTWKFGASDRVIACHEDLAAIEAYGSVTPFRFIAPQAFRELVEDQHRFLDQQFIRQKFADECLLNDSVVELNPLRISGKLQDFREMYVSAPWMLLSPEAPTGRLTIENLFIGIEQMASLQGQEKPSSSVSLKAAKPHGNTLNNAKINDGIIAIAEGLFQKRPILLNGRVNFTQWAVQTIKAGKVVRSHATVVDVLKRNFDKKTGTKIETSE